MNNASLAKATILNLDKGGEKIQCLFNPTEYTFTKQNSWTRDQGKGANVPQLEFSSGQPATLQMQLLFDTYTQNSSGGAPEDVRKKYTDGLWRLMMIDEDLMDPKSKKARPPRVRFQWGKSWTFDAVITSLSERFTLFGSDGTPVRATVTVTFEQIKDEKQLRPQNPTSGGQGGERAWTVGEGDTLGWIAYKVYGDTSRWRVIADVNQLSRVRKLTAGTTLLIPNV